MTESLESLRKNFAARLAEIAMSADGTKALRMLEHSRLLRMRSAQSEENTADVKDLLGWESFPQASNGNRVGIWERNNKSSHFVRRLDLRKDWPYWANITRIDAKGAKKRVILLGESVARGYLYDPQFTPAMALESMLKSFFGENSVEVIDLAELGAGFRVGELALSALALEPDAAIIFAGNNWRSPQFRKVDIPYADSIVRQQGIPGIKLLFENQLAEKVNLLIKAVSPIYEEKKIPLLWIIPEFNLGDWRDPISSAPYLSGDANTKWISYQELATSALRDGNISKASEMAKKMIELDRGVSPAGLYLLADCSRHQGNATARRAYLEAARDAGIWDISVPALSPRSFSVSQNILREEVLRFENNEVVDLPRFFFDYLEGGLPDRRLFLDYCHMTSEAIQVSMAAAASRIVQSLNHSHVPWQTFVSRSCVPDSKVEAEAAFVAAVHNAHNHQEYDLVRHYCSTALRFAPEIKEVMIRFAKVQASGNPIFLSAVADELIEMPWPSIQRYLFQEHTKQLDKNLLDAIGHSLDSVGTNASIAITQTRKEEQSVTVSQTNLLDHYYCSSANQPRENLWTIAGVLGNKQQECHRAHGPISRFFFVADALCPVCLSITCRLPHLSSGLIGVHVNGKCQCQIAADSGWATWDLTVDAEAMIDGINEVTIHWPTPVFSTEDALNLAADDIGRNWLPRFYCSFGDIHTFTVKTGNDPHVPRSVSENSGLFF
jgi:hypothetical protein